MKKKKYAGDIKEKKIWKSELEMIIAREVPTSVNWSNTEIRRVNRLLVRTGAWTDKQLNVFIANSDKIIDGDTSTRAYIMEKFKVRDQDYGKFVRENQGSVFQLLRLLSSEWNEYFNS